MAKFNITDLLNNQSKAETPKASFVIREIPIDKIIPSDKNKYGIREIEELAASIELVGLMHNLVVRDLEDGTFELVSGERRYRALKLLNHTTAPCKVEKQPDNVISELELILANSTARELTDYEKTYQAGRLKELLMELKKSGYDIPGRMRDMIADIMNVSSTQVAIMESINKNLTPEFKEEFMDGKIGISAAYDLSTLPPEKQVETHKEYKAAGFEAVKDVKRKNQKEKVIASGEDIHTAYAIRFSGGGYRGDGHAHGVSLYRADLFESFEKAEADRVEMAEYCTDMRNTSVVKIILDPNQ